MVVMVVVVVMVVMLVVVLVSGDGDSGGGGVDDGGGGRKGVGGAERTMYSVSAILKLDMQLSFFFLSFFSAVQAI